MEERRSSGARRGCVFVVLLPVVLLLAYVTYLWSVDFFAVDSCLDSGGSYHYDRGECSFTENYQGEVPPLPWLF